MGGSNTLISLSSLFSLFLLATHLSSGAAAGLRSTRASTEFIKTWCSGTSYPLVCIQSLSIYATAIQTSPKQLTSVALSISLDEARSTAALMSKLSVARGLKAREVGAMRDCVDNVGDSVDELQRSVGELGRLGGAEARFAMSNIETWVSAALTDEDTCMDGFAGKVMEGKVKGEVRRRIVNLAQLTSNALALINSFASTQSTSSP